MKKRIFAAFLAAGMIMQTGAFAKTLSDQDFNLAEDISITYPQTDIWGGWSTVNASGYRQSKIGVTDGRVEFGKLPQYTSSGGTMGIGIQKSVNGVTEDDDYLVFEFDWYVLRCEAVWSDAKGSYWLKSGGDTAVMPPFGSRAGVAWKDGFGLYYTNSAGTDIPLFFMSIAYDVAYYNTLWFRASVGTEKPAETEPKISRVQITDTKIDLTKEDTYRYRFVIDLKNKVNDKYRYDLYLKVGDDEYIKLTDKENQTYTLTAAEIPSKIRIANQIRVTPTNPTTDSVWTYDFDDDGIATPFVEKSVVDNYQCYTIDTDETVSKVTYLDGCGNATDTIVDGETYKASITYNNTTDGSLPLVMISGFYNSQNDFCNSIPEIKQIPSGFGAITGAQNVFNIDSAVRVKGMAWNSFSKMVPYSDFTDITITPTAE